MDSEDPQERPEDIVNIISGLERYNPEAVGNLEDYLRHQCENRYTDSNANRTLLKLYQLNPDRVKEEVITNTLVKALTCFPSPQFSLALHLIPPHLIANPQAELAEAVTKLRELSNQLQGAQYARFWATLDSDDLYADLTTDIDGFEELIRVRIATLISHAYREVELPVLEQWLGLDGPAALKFVSETAGWRVEGNLVKIPKNPENEAKKSEVREDVNVDMFSRVIRRAWEETV
ncbi:eukaryotic translation initiation factor 3 subunit K [Hypoxylon trugodes]|uniref:eukaryotic translation initiation factor 3 subunit K n=1 Tax=Hypoxylon trugodes TaxID=326681 RepID=UPI00219A16EB|nr:eukaryotic translation initiation factor 3 subunit K [Hypoxylon trugodes]KAI1385941.1 eukaryotic translation initiation factor 3 subunit K [Hypoxylon trugodes]